MKKFLGINFSWGYPGVISIDEGKSFAIGKWNVSLYCIIPKPKGRLLYKIKYFISSIFHCRGHKTYQFTNVKLAWFSFYASKQLATRELTLKDKLTANVKKFNPEFWVDWIPNETGYQVLDKDYNIVAKFSFDTTFQPDFDFETMVRENRCF